MAVSSRGHRKQIVIFLLAVILPSLILVVFTLRMISQEKELAQKRAVDERRRLAGEIDQHLLVRLEKIKLQESSAAANWTQLSAKHDYMNPEVVLIGLVEGNRLLLPWEENQKKEEFRRLLSSSDFARKIRSAEKEEFAKKNFLRAVQLYRQSMKTAQEPVQRGYACLLLAARVGEVVTHDELLDEVWGYDHYPTTRTVDNHIALLRSKLEDDPSKPHPLLTGLSLYTQKIGVGSIFSFELTG